jgi:phosphoribosylglycinamide formyltransferase
LQPYLRTAPETRTRIDYDLEVARRLITKSQDPIDIIVLAGFMHILSAEFLSVFTGDREYAEGKKLGKPVPIINLHPALPGAFDGADALPRAWDAFQQGKMGDNPKTGAMVHQVVPEVDRGEPIVVREVEMKEMNSLEELEEKIHAVEHEIIVEAVIKLLA